jgi:predicted membrane-bound dolichyl-phosphate-mannose-protein mannosyltransferase
MKSDFSGLLRFSLLFFIALSLIDLLILIILVIFHAYSPSTLSIAMILPLVYLLAGASTVGLISGLVYFFIRYPDHRNSLYFIVILTAGMFFTHLYIINSPSTPDCYSSEKRVNGCVMDEVYYVPAAEMLLSGKPCAPYAENCNLEHPFLSKAFIAAGIQLFGLNVFGWRFFQVFLGSLSIPVLFGVCMMATKNRRLAYYASLLLAFDTLFFVHSSIAVIDVHGIFFALLSFLFYFSKLHLWKFDRLILAGISLALAGLSKETSIFFLFFLLSYHLLFGGGAFRSRLLDSIKISVIVAVVFSIGLQIFDTLMAPSVGTFLSHLRFIITYGSSLTGPGWIDSLLKTPITPFDWLLFYSPVGYYITNVTVTAGESVIKYVGIGYYGITNKLETWLTFLWAPYVIYLLVKQRRNKIEQETTSADFRLANFSLFWLIWTYFPYVLLYLFGRVTYPFYLLPAVPAMAIGGAYILSREWFPRIVALFFLVAVFGWFLLYYPDKSFLPAWLREILGR